MVLSFEATESNANALAGSKQSYVVLVKPSFSRATTFNDTFPSSFSFSVFLFTYFPSFETSGAAPFPESEFAPRETLKFTMVSQILNTNGGRSVDDDDLGGTEALLSMCSMSGFTQSVLNSVSNDAKIFRSRRIFLLLNRECIFARES